MRDLYLAADIGGTKTDLGLYRIEGERLSTVRESTVPTSSYGSASGIFDTFLLMEAPRLKAACIAVAGHVRNGEVDAPNLPWGVNLTRLKASLETGEVLLVNDLVATAWGVINVGDGELSTIQHGIPDPVGTRALLAPGTGLGECIIANASGKPLPIPTEGGHADFAPTGEMQISLLEYAAARLGGHVSWERIVSGNGLKLIYDFVLDSGMAAPTPDFSERVASRDPVPAITEAGVNRTDPAADAAVGLYLELLGAEAGNLALKTLSTGGLVLSGGMWARLLPRVAESGFLRAFAAKGRMEGLMTTIPVYSAALPRIALLGASRLALATFRN